MTATKAALKDDMRLSAREFDRIMGKALQVKPKDAKQKKKSPRKRAVGSKSKTGKR